jgi:head-tail adaptor
MSKNRPTDIGRMAYQVSIDKRAQVPQDDGGFIETWTELRTGVWCSIKYWKDMERIQQESMSFDDKMFRVFEMRLFADVNTDNSLRFDGYRYSISRIENIGMENYFMRLYCTGTKLEDV